MLISHADRSAPSGLPPAQRDHARGAAAPVLSVSFVIPVKNDAARLRRCLATIAENDYSREAIEIIVVDNGSRDQSVAVARAAGATVLSSPDATVAQLRNRGARIASGKVLAFVDADHEIDAGWIRAATDAFADPTVGAAGALCQAPTAGTWVQRAYDALRARRPGRHDVEWLGSGNLAVRRDLFERAQGFDERLVTCEDVDLCRRLRSMGVRLVSDARIRAVHLGDPASLRALFRGELWRGRDNLRVSLRGPLSLRALPSVVIPVVDLGCVALVGVGLIMGRRGWPLALAGGLLAASLSGLRALKMVTSSGTAARPPFAHALAVAFVYDMARAFALAMRSSHRTRRTESQPSERDGTPNPHP